MSRLGKVRDKAADYEALFRMATELTQLGDYEELLDALVTRSLSLLGGDRGFLALKQGGSINFKIVRNWSSEELVEGKEPVSRTILAETLSSTRPLLFEDAASDPRFQSKDSIQSLSIRSVLAAPLFVEGSLWGALYLESRSTKQFFSQEELVLFEKILAFSSRALALTLRQISLEQQNKILERGFLAPYDFPGIVSCDDRFLKILKQAGQVASADVPVLIQGASGTGKELIAKAIHLNSPRKRQPFLTLNCGSLSPSLLESELFGYVKGAFTGATQNKLGIIAAAHNGTLFLDEVGELPKDFQVKLLRTLQFGEVQPVGSTQQQRYDVRFVAATNRDLEEEVEEGNFRQDLLYRLNTITLELPSLRERRGDIILLFRHFLQLNAERAGRVTPKLFGGFEEVLVRYEWPGNVRELENEAKRVLALTPPGEVASLEALSARVLEQKAAGVMLRSLAETEREQVELHLRASGGNRTKAADTLGITRQGLLKMLKRYKLG